jgi:hypothetical protein
VIATGGLPQNDAIREGGELAKSSWDILSGDVAASGDVLVLDENGSQPALVCTEFLADQGVSVEFVTPERNFAPDAGGLNLVPYMRSFVRRGVKITTMTGISRLERQGNQIKATLWSPYTMADCGERSVDMVIVENATAPLDDLYFTLKPGSLNWGEVEYPALIAGRPQALRKNEQGTYPLFRPHATSTRPYTMGSASLRRSEVSSVERCRRKRQGWPAEDHVRELLGRHDDRRTDIFRDGRWLHLIDLLSFCGNSAGFGGARRRFSPV